MDKLECRIRKTDTVGLFHDSRNDVKTLSKVVNMLIDKVDEMVDEINALKSEAHHLKIKS